MIDWSQNIENIEHRGLVKNNGSEKHNDYIHANGNNPLFLFDI